MSLAKKEAIFQKQVPNSFMFVKPALTSTPKNYTAILQQSALYWNPQKWLLHDKTKKYATCTAQTCRRKIEVGTKCLVVDGALRVPYGEDSAKPQKFYFCSNSNKCVNKGNLLQNGRTSPHRCFLKMKKPDYIW